MLLDVSVPPPPPPKKKREHKWGIVVWQMASWHLLWTFNATFSTISVIAVSFIGVGNYQSVQNDYIIRVVTSFERVVE
jgi:hypothetical protein